ncbi:hypothetical protein E4U24_003709 [Claviceps purpurea]|nr:hypothetical protein E4U24_003709 [Claviceps purpurea]KAG6264321.1 hypothetical protein E4U49_001719 [Claviceps purpurea]
MHYDSDLEAYEGGQKKIRELTALTQSTVSLYLQRECCLPDRPLQEWLSNLKSKLGLMIVKINHLTHLNSSPPLPNSKKGATIVSNKSEHANDIMPPSADTILRQLGYMAH